jgi:hypothetical protein
MVAAGAEAGLALAVEVVGAAECGWLLPAAAHSFILQQ